VAGLPTPTRRGVTRRTFVAASAAATAATAAALELAGCSSSTTTHDTTGEPQVITDESKIVDVLSDYESADANLEAQASWDLPLGTVPIHCGGSWAALLMAPASAKAVNTLGALSLSSGSPVTLVSEAASGTAYGFHDVRCSDGAFGWVEMNYGTGDWVLMGQAFSAGQLTGLPVQLDQGNADWEPPRLTATGSSIIWQKMPFASGSKRAEKSHCYRWTVGDDGGEKLIESSGRFATFPRVSNGVLTVAPRVNADEGVYYGLTAINLSDGSTVDQLVMPQTVSPFEAVYMDNTFAFSVEANYSSGGSLGNMGTFIGREGGPYIYLSREPLACVAGKGSRYFVKAQSSHFILDASAQTYAVLTAPDKTLEYGDYPASEGIVDQFVTYATVRDDTGLPSLVRVRAFAL